MRERERAANRSGIIHLPLLNSQNSDKASPLLHRRRSRLLTQRGFQTLRMNVSGGKAEQEEEGKHKSRDVRSFQCVAMSIMSTIPNVMCQLFLECN